MLASLFDASVWTALAAAVVAAAASILFLRSRNFFYDALALAATEAGLLLLAAGIAAGVIAGRSSAGLWWTWDARLTAALVGFLLYAPYLMLRKAIEEPSRRAASAAVVSIFAVFNLPLIALVVHWWLGRRTAGAGLPIEWSAAPVVVLGAALAWMRLRREQRRRAQDAERRTAQEI
jgi:ABC-type transport system involved in cytochrome c biogenesis permease subunit